MTLRLRISIIPFQGTKTGPLSSRITPFYSKAVVKHGGGIIQLATDRDVVIPIIGGSKITSHTRWINEFISVRPDNSCSKLFGYYWHRFDEFFSHWIKLCEFNQSKKRKCVCVRARSVVTSFSRVSNGIWDVRD